MPSINRSKIDPKYKGKWVALKADRKTVVASGKDVKSVLKAAQKKGYDQPIVTRLAKKPMNFVGLHSVL